MNDNLVVSNTPWELYEVDGVLIHVKREDLCSPFPGPSFSKIRGVERHLRGLQKPITVGVVDTVHSKAGWGVAYICQALGLRCIDFYPVRKADIGLRYNQRMAFFELGAELAPLQAGMSAVLYNRAKTILKQMDPNSIMMPNGLKLQESVDATAEELVDYTPKSLLCGTWVVSTSSGTLTAGVMKGLHMAGFDGTVISHMGYHRDHDNLMKYLQTASGSHVHVVLVDEGYDYKDGVDNSWIPFPCNEFYDAKAFKWLCNDLHAFEEPICFWNIGA